MTALQLHAASFAIVQWTGSFAPVSHACVLHPPQARPNDALLLATLLQTPLSSLRAKGFPVDRLLSKPKAEAKAKAIHRPTAQPPAAHEMHHQGA
jgi:hypothetical protein